MRESLHANSKLFRIKVSKSSPFPLKKPVFTQREEGGMVSVILGGV